MKHIKLLLAFVALLFLVGCSKALTESSSRGTVQKSVDGQGAGIVTTFAGALTGRMGVEMAQRWSAASVQRMIKESYIQETTSTISYPNFSGEFRGSHQVPGDLQPSHFDTYNLQTTADRPPRVVGSFKDCTPFSSAAAGQCTWGSLNGTINGHGPSHFSLKQEAGWPITNFSGEEMNLNPRQFPVAFPGPWFPLTVVLVRGNPDRITGTYGQFPIQLLGHATGPDMQQETYTYNWTGKLPKDTFNGQFLRLGHLVVDSCDHLLLASETAATASCKTHIELTGGAEIIFGRRPTDQSMNASFGKQPDGTWVCTNINYSPPQYDINQ